jgi:hypothetical protein
MASGHANRANRPNTWLHRPATRRDVLTCQLGAVHTWHLTETEVASTHVRSQSQSGLRMGLRLLAPLPTRTADKIGGKVDRLEWRNPQGAIPRNRCR